MIVKAKIIALCYGVYNTYKKWNLWHHSTKDGEQKYECALKILHLKWCNINSVYIMLCMQIIVLVQSFFKKEQISYSLSLSLWKVKRCAAQTCLQHADTHSLSSAGVGYHSFLLFFFFCRLTPGPGNQPHPRLHPFSGGKLHPRGPAPCASVGENLAPGLLVGLAKTFIASRSQFNFSLHLFPPSPPLGGIGPEAPP